MSGNRGSRAIVRIDGNLLPRVDDAIERAVEQHGDDAPYKTRKDFVSQAVAAFLSEPVEATTQ